MACDRDHRCSSQAEVSDPERQDSCLAFPLDAHHTTLQAVNPSWHCSRSYWYRGTGGAVSRRGGRRGVWQGNRQPARQLQPLAHLLRQQRQASIKSATYSAGPAPHDPACCRAAKCSTFHPYRSPRGPAAHTVPVLECCRRICWMPPHVQRNEARLHHGIQGAAV